MNSFLYKTLLLIFLNLVLGGVNGFGQKTFTVPADEDFITIPRDFFLSYEDPTSQLTFEQVSQADFQEQFKPIESNPDFKTPSENARWVTFKLKGAALLNKKWILEIPTNTVPFIDAYIVESSSGKVSTFEVGSNRPMGNKMIPHKNFLFDLPLHQEEIQVYAKYRVTANAPFMFWLKTNSYMLRYSNKEYIMLGVFYGILFIMGVYNLFLFLMTRERISLVFALYVFSSILLTTVTDGLGFQYIWPNIPSINPILSKIAPHLYIGSLLFFVAAFLRLPKTQKKFLNIILLISVGILLINLFQAETNWASNIISYLLPIVLIYIANINSIKQGFKPAKSLLFGQTFILISFGIIFLRKFGLVDYSILTPWQLILIVYALNIALVVEVLLFSIAQTNKFKFYQLQKEKVLMASEKRFRNIFESCFDAILVYDIKNQKIIDANESAFHLFQKDKNQLKQTVIENIIDFNRVPIDGAQLPLSSKFVDKKGKLEFDTTGQKTNGDTIECEVSLSLMEKEKQELMVITINDSSERKKAERALTQKIQEITQKKEELERYIASNSELKSFAYVVSHDMKQPLRTVSSFSSLLGNHLEEKGIVDEDSKEYINFIKSGVKSMQTLINGLLNHAKITAAGNLQFENNNLNDLLKEVELNLNKQISENKVQLNLHPLPKNLAISKVKVNQLFQNLISNAIKFRKKEEPCIISVRASEKEQYWEFQVQDNGIGIPKKFHDKIFQLFKKLHNQRDYKGSGVGLATCKKVVELHGGTMGINSEEGVGTTFHFTILKNLDKTTVLPRQLAEVN